MQFIHLNSHDVQVSDISSVIKKILSEQNSVMAVAKDPIFCPKIFQVSNALIASMQENKSTKTPVCYALSGAHDIVFHIELSPSNKNILCLSYTYQLKHEKNIISVEEEGKITHTTKRQKLNL